MPAAGLSTRFPNMRPKYTLTDFTGKMMFEKALAPYIGKFHITLGILQEHEDKYNISDYVSSVYKNEITLVILKDRTLGPADTVYKILQQANIEPTCEIMIKDCDSFFDHDVSEGNYVCISNIKDHLILKRLGSKSFVISNDQGIINTIVEKQVVSGKFCVGGYKFESAELFVQIYKQLSNSYGREIFVSHIIEECLNLGYIFLEKPVYNYVDVGTADDWFEYNDKAVVFCDIDGTIVKAQHRHNFSDPPVPLANNLQKIKDMADNGCLIIFTTARPKNLYDNIYQMLKNLGFKDFQLIAGLPNTKRILINDYNEANPFPRAIAVNIKRDTDNLKDYL